MHRIRKLSSSITDLLSTRKRNSGKSGEDEDLNYSKNPLHLAVAIQDVERIRYLLDSGVCDVDEEDSRGRIPLQISVLGSNFEITRLLIREYGSCVDHADFQQSTSAHLIAKHNKIDHCRILLEFGGDFTSEDKYGRTPFDLACELGHEELVDLLIEYGCIKEILNNLNTRLHLSTSALHLAARNGHVKICYKLLQEGFDLNLKTDNGSALHEAIVSGQIQVVRLLLHLGIDNQIRDRNGKCATMLASEQCENRSIHGHMINTLMQQYPFRIYGKALEDQRDSLNSSRLSFKAYQQIWIIDRSNHHQWKGIVFDEFGESKCGFFEPHLVRIEKIVSNQLPLAKMPSLRSVKDANGRMTTMRRMKRVEMPTVPDLPGMEEELNRRRSRHFSNGAPEPINNASNQNFEYCAPTAPNCRESSIAGSSSRASSNCADHSDYYAPLDRTQYSSSSFSSAPGMSNANSRNCGALSTFQQQAISSVPSATKLQQSHRNSTGSSSSQASSGFESSKTLNNLANSNSSGSFGSTLFTSDSSPPPSIGISGTDTLRKVSSNRHSSTGSDNSSRPRSQCAQIHNSPQINICEMISRGIPDSEILGEWLDKMGMQKYLSLFITQGYDVPSVARLTSEDLLALGISEPGDRRRLHANIQEWNVNDNWPTNLAPTESASFWLVTIGLQQYVRLFETEGYIQMKDLENLNFEELEDMGIKKLGHIKRICLALKKLKQSRQQSTNTNYSSSTNNLISIPSLSACTTSPSSAQQPQQYSPDSGFTENSSIFSTIQRPRLPSQGQNNYRQSMQQNDYNYRNDDLLEKPVSKLQIYSTRQIFAENNEALRHGIPSLQLRPQHSPPPPAPLPSNRMLSARPDFYGNLHQNGQYGYNFEDQMRQFRSQPSTPIRQQQSLGSFAGSNLSETSFMMTGLSSEPNAIQMAK